MRLAYAGSILVLAFANSLALASRGTGTLIDVDVSTPPTAPTSAAVGDVVRLKIAATGITSVSTSSSGSMVAQIGTVYDPGLNAVYSLYAANSLGSTSVTFSYVKDGVQTSVPVVINVGISGAATIIQATVEGGPYPINGRVGDVIRITYKRPAGSLWDISTNGDMAVLSAKTVEGDLSVAYFSVVKAGTGTINIKTGAETGAIFNVTVSARR